MPLSTEGQFRNELGAERTNKDIPLPAPNTLRSVSTGDCWSSVAGRLSFVRSVGVLPSGLRAGGFRPEMLGDRAVGSSGVGRGHLPAREHWAAWCTLPRYRVFVPGSGVGVRGAGITLSSPVVEKVIFRSAMAEPRGEMIHYTLRVPMFQELMTPENTASVPPGRGW